MTLKGVLAGMGSRAATTALLAGLLLLPRPGAAGEVGEYRIGVDDVLAVSVWDNRDVDQVVFVRPDGKISLPLAGEVQASGLTVAELENTLAELYRKTVKDARVTVVVREIRSRPIFFVGGLGRSGPMQLTQDLTLLQAISIAGGLAQGANQEAAFILRGATVLPINLHRLIQKADVSQNMKLQPGDTIVVPVADVVYVQGEVRGPTAVKFSNDLTMLEAIARAGGFTTLAAGGRVSLIRGEGTKRENIRLNVDEMMKGAAPDVPLKPNDIIVVPQRLF